MFPFYGVCQKPSARIDVPRCQKCGQKISVTSADFDKDGVLIVEERCQRCERPPLGLKPKFIHDEQRRDEVVEAIKRYIDAKRPIPTAWIDEYNEYASKGAKR